MKLFTVHPTPGILPGAPKTLPASAPREMIVFVNILRFFWLELEKIYE